MGHKMLSWYPWVPIGGLMGINCAILTYNGTAYFGFTGDVHAAPDLERLEKFVDQSFAKLRAGADAAARAEAQATASEARATECEDSSGEGEDCSQEVSPVGLILQTESTGSSSGADCGARKGARRRRLTGVSARGSHPTFP